MEFQLIGFPKSEHSDLKKRLAEGKICYTTRVSVERDKYSIGCSYETPWGDIVTISNIETFDKVNDHPFFNELSPDQRKIIYNNSEKIGKKYSLITFSESHTNESMIDMDDFDDFFCEDASSEAGVFNYILEDAKETNIVSFSLYPKVSAVMSTPRGRDAFRNLVGNFVDRNSTKLHTAGPLYLIPFTDTDKQQYYDLFDTSSDEIKKIVKEIVLELNAKANWKLLKDNPVFVLFFCVIRYCTLKNDGETLNMALGILALSMYPSIHSKYMSRHGYRPNEAVMKYTMDSLSNKFTIKKQGHIFGTLMVSIQQSWKFHERNIRNGADKNVVDFIMRIRNDQNSFMKKISNAYYDNHKKNLTVYTSVDSFDDNSIVDVENNSNRVEMVTHKITLAFIANGVDYNIAKEAANTSRVSVMDTRNYLNAIINERNLEDMKAFIESILFIYLYDEKRGIDEINSKHFLLFAFALFKKTNSKDKNITNIKNILDKWGEMVGLNETFTRKATLVDYKRAIFMYFVFSIQRFNDL